MMTKFFYIVDHYVPFPSSEYGGIWNVIAEDDDEMSEFDYELDIEIDLDDIVTLVDEFVEGFVEEFAEESEDIFLQ